MKNKLMLLTMVVPLGMGVLPLAAKAQTAVKAETKVVADIQQAGTHGHIDWGKGIIYATGVGALSPTESSRAKAYLKARRFAEIEAYRNLRIIVDGIHVDSHTVAKDFEVTEDEIKTEVSGFVKGAVITKEERILLEGEPAVRVVIASDMYGDHGLGKILIPAEVHRNTEAPAKSTEQPPVTPMPEPIKPSETTGPESTPSAGPYTSVIIDTRGFHIERCMAPKIKFTNGQEVWGTVNADPDFVLESGIVLYALSMDVARKIDRAGANPLILKAVGRGGGRFPADAILSDADAHRLLEINSHDHFLENFKVIFLVDPAKPLNL